MNRFVLDKSISFLSKRLEIHVFAFAFFWFVISLAPTISWGDSADLATRISGNQILEWNLTERDYDLFEFMGRIFGLLPFGDLGYRANLMSAFFGAISASLLYKITEKVSKSGFAGLVASISLVVSHTFWLLSSVAEVYTFSTTILFLIVYATVRWRENPSDTNSALLGTLLGLSIFHHSGGVVLLFSFSIYTFLYSRHLIKARNFVFFIIPLISITYFSNWFQLGLREVSNGVSLLSFLPTAPSNVMHNADIKTATLLFVAFSIYNFPTLLIAIIVFLQDKSLRRMLFRSPLFVLLLNSTLTAAAGITSSIPDKYNMYVIAYPAFALMIGLASPKLLRIRDKVTLNGAIAIVICVIGVNTISYWSVWQIANYKNFDLSNARILDGRDNNRYFAWPPKRGDYEPRDLATKRLKQSPNNSILLADYTIFTTIKFIQLTEKYRQDVEVVLVENIPNTNLGDYAKFQNGNGRRVFLATNAPSNYYFLDTLSDRYKLEPFGSLFEVMQK